jgi:hypothetical protein
MREMSVTEQRYKAVLAVIADGRTVTEVAKDGLVIPCVPGALYKSGKSRPQGLSENGRKSGVCINIIPVARGLPQALAAVRDCSFDSPVLRVRRRRCGLA